jgi:sulfatase modifying factor 1
MAVAAWGVGCKKTDEGGEVANGKEAAAKEISTSTVLVKGGTLPADSALAGQGVGDFWIGRTEVTWGEWKETREWAVGKGYDLAGVGGTYPANGGDNLPVVKVSWYDVVKWCNARSEREGKTAVYEANGGVYRMGIPRDSTSVTMKSGANGYRLPLEKEWEWAARGGVNSKGYAYSGSNVVGEVAWTSENSPSGTQAVGGKKANELGLSDMSGNVWEWVWDFDGTSNRRVRGGSWFFIAYSAVVSFRDDFSSPDFRDDDLGFRVAFSSGQ